MNELESFQSDYEKFDRAKETNLTQIHDLEAGKRKEETCPECGDEKAWDEEYCIKCSDAIEEV